MLTALIQMGTLISACVSVLCVCCFRGVTQHCDPNRSTSRQQELAVWCRSQGATQDNEQKLLESGGKSSALA